MVNVGKHTIDGCYGLEFKGSFVEFQIGVETKKNFLLTEILMYSGKSFQGSRSGPL